MSKTEQTKKQSDENKEQISTPTIANILIKPEEISVKSKEGLSSENPIIRTLIL